MEDRAMRRAVTWGLPLYAAIMTGIFVGKSLPENNLRAEVAHGDEVKAIAVTTATPSAPASGSAATYPIPAPTTQPKHLLHVVIRYEGEGLPNQSMITAALAGQAEDEKSKKGNKSKPGDTNAAKAKDMFQFLIRYEGDGLIDDNVAKVLKDYFAAEKAAEASAQPRCVPPKGATLPSLDAESSEKPMPTPAASPRIVEQNRGGATPASPREYRAAPASAPGPRPATLPLAE
jgi:hypothetical protein